MSINPMNEMSYSEILSRFNNNDGIRILHDPKIGTVKVVSDFHCSVIKNRHGIEITRGRINDEYLVEAYPDMNTGIRHISLTVSGETPIKAMIQLIGDDYFSSLLYAAQHWEDSEDAFKLAEESLKRLIG